MQRFHRAGVAAGDLSGHAEQGDEKHTEHEHGVQAADGVVGAPIAPWQHGIDPVSYTHLDVYKRQCRPRACGWRAAPQT